MATKYKIEDVATVQTGVYLKETLGGQVHYLQVKDFDANIDFKLAEPSIILDDKVERHLLSEGDLLFAAKGFVNFCISYRKAWGLAVASSSFLVLKIKYRSEILPEFVAWSLNRKDILAGLKAYNAGSVMPSISKAMMEETQITVPSIDMQKKIIELSKLAKQEHNLRERIANLRKQMVEEQLIQIIE